MLNPNREFKGKVLSRNTEHGTDGPISEERGEEEAGTVTIELVCISHGHRQ